MTSTRRLTFVALVALLQTALATFAAVPSQINFQGRLTDNSPTQAPIDGTSQMSFSIWDATSGGNELWAEPASGTIPIPVVKGIFSILLGGNGVPIPPTVFDSGGNLYLQIVVDGETLQPRQALGSVPYAVRADVASDASALGGQPPQSWQARVVDTCPTGFAIQQVHEDGTVSCVQGPVGPQGSQGIQGPPGPAGTTGQSATTVYGSAQLTVTSATFVAVPGLVQSVSVPAAAAVYVATDGGIATTSAAAGGFSAVSVALFVDGVLVSPGGYRRVVATNNSGIGGTIETWSLSLSPAISAGLHTFEIRAALSQGANALVSGDPSSILEGELTVIILKQ